MQISITNNSGTAELKLSGRFDFNVHRDFRSAYESLVNDVSVRAINVDMAGVEYLDSSALGMLLMLRDKVNAAGKTLSLLNAQGSVRQVLDIANFGKLFTIA